MKVSTQLRGIYEDRRPFYERLRAEVDTKIAGLRDSRWHYESRVKQEESFALKVETGRVDSPATMEDFFAAMLVVPDLLAVEAAEVLIRENFSVVGRRPKDGGKTHKMPDSFPFDDLRLFMSIKRDERFAESPFVDTVFELQIKTFLQHAWSIATHDLIYKSDDVNWARERIAYQVKAMLEHAEVSIAEAKLLSESRSISKTTPDSERVIEIITMIKELWGNDAPKDVRRLATTFDEICTRARISSSGACAAIKARVANGTLSIPLNKSPYTVLLEQLSSIEAEPLRTYLYRATRPGDWHRVFIPPDAEMSASFVLGDIKRGVMIPTN